MVRLNLLLAWVTSIVCTDAGGVSDGVRYTRNSGFLSSGDNLMKKVATRAQAETDCTATPECVGFTMKGGGGSERVWFKSAWHLQSSPQETSWVSYQKNDAQGNSDRQGSDLSETTDPPEYSRGLIGGTLGFIKEAVDEHARPILLHRAALAVAALHTLLWHLKLSRHSKLRAVCEGIVIVQIYYGDYLKGVVRHRAFASTLIFLIVDHGIMWQISNLLPWKASDDRQVEKEGNFATCKYMVISNGFDMCILYFIAQCGLMCYYIYALNGNWRTHYVDQVSFLAWILALILTIVAGENEVGHGFNKPFWDTLNLHEIADKYKTWFGVSAIRVKYRTEFYFRRAFAFIVNAMFRAVLLGTAPIMLCVDEPMDFILNCLAVFFITRLDDLDDPKKIDTIIKDTMSTNYYDRNNPSDKADTPLLQVDQERSCSSTRLCFH